MQKDKEDQGRRESLQLVRPQKGLTKEQSHVIGIYAEGTPDRGDGMNTGITPTAQ